jgi:GNAT superfamily N-acetyltransferase
MNDSTSNFLSESELTFRLATRDDVRDIVRMLADDALGAQRETYGPSLQHSYYAAFEIISRDANNELVVGCLAGRVIAVLQLTFIPYLTHRGSWRALIEGVRIDSSVRSRGIGRKLIAWAVERARQRDCHMVQLTSDKARADAIRFYESLGFVASHEGFKLHLNSRHDAEQ